MIPALLIGREGSVGFPGKKYLSGIGEATYGLPFTRCKECNVR